MPLSMRDLTVQVAGVSHSVEILKLFPCDRRPEFSIIQVLRLSMASFQSSAMTSTLRFINVNASGLIF
jgi:hypothetical protein